MLKKSLVLLISAWVFLGLFALVCIYLNSIEPQVIKSYDRVSSVPLGEADDGLLVKEKKYDYKDSDVLIMSVENTTENAYTLLIKSTFVQADGTEVKLIKLFHGFPAKHQNYFVFETGIRFDSHNYEIITRPYSKETYAQNFKWGTDITVEAQPFTTDYRGNVLDEYVTYVRFFADTELSLSKGVKASLDRDVVIFDTSGEIYCIDNQKCTYDSLTLETVGNMDEAIYSENSFVPWEDYVLPQELKGDVRAIVAINSIRVQ